jgi:UDPglucose--hexose-1-phosphate uridylyltransferase
MPEIRYDPITGRKIIIAPERAERPRPIETALHAARPLICPFCVGNEAMTPPEVWVDRTDDTEPDKSAWSVRVVPNKYPAFTQTAPSKAEQDALYKTEPACGVHEVIIESAAHAVHMNALSTEQLARVLRSYLARCTAMEADPRWRYVLIYKNQGERAGATLEHVHSQLVALPTIPREAACELDGARARFELTGRCVYCAIIERECQTGVRRVTANDRFIALCPFAPRYAYETWILPKIHAARFTMSSDEDLVQLAGIMLNFVRKLDSIAENAPFNYLLRSAHLRDAADDSYHWHLQILPQLNRTAGFEWGSGMYLNPVAPEHAARLLRDAPG